MKEKRAVALSYDENEIAPRIIAKGFGQVAENIIEKAEESGVIIYEDSYLVNSLMEVNLSDYIPEELYELVAEVIFYVYTMDLKKGG